MYGMGASKIYTTFRVTCETQQMLALQPAIKGELYMVAKLCLLEQSLRLFVAAARNPLSKLKCNLLHLGQKEEKPRKSHYPG